MAAEARGGDEQRRGGERAGQGGPRRSSRAKAGPVKGLTANLQQTLTSARDVMADMAETTEALKRNFLVRGFFNRAGLFRPGRGERPGLPQAACSRTRIAARCGCGSSADPCCSRRTSKGSSGSARAGASASILPCRSSSGIPAPARSSWKVTRSSPPPRPAVPAQPLAGSSWSATTSSASYGLDPKVIAAMPMGNEADGSPAGKTWDGIGLALFVPVTSVRG